MIQMYDAAMAGDYATARKIHFSLAPLFRTLFMETNPVPVKKAAEMRGFASGPVRLPLDEATTNTVDKLQEVLTRYD
jgi:4-hydroxy-tetrahydrodipicolinate synthase